MVSAQDFIIGQISKSEEAIEFHKRSITFYEELPQTPDTIKAINKYKKWIKEFETYIEFLKTPL